MIVSTLRLNYKFSNNNSVNDKPFIKFLERQRRNLGVLDDTRNINITGRNNNNILDRQIALITSNNNNNLRRFRLNNFINNNDLFRRGNQYDIFHILENGINVQENVNINIINQNLIVSNLNQIQSLNTQGIITEVAAQDVAIHVQNVVLRAANSFFINGWWILGGITILGSLAYIINQNISLVNMVRIIMSRNNTIPVSNIIETEQINDASRELNFFKILSAFLSGLLIRNIRKK